MPKTSTKRTFIVHARVDARRGKRVNLILNELGVTPTELVNMVYAQVDHLRRIPFPLSLEPTDETLTSMNEDMSKRPVYKSVASFMKSLLEDDAA